MLLTAASCKKEVANEDQRPLAPAPKLQTQMDTDDRPVIVAFGDSLTAGFGVEPGLSYPDFLQKELDAAGYRYRVQNEGISGDTSSGGVARMESVLRMKPAIVILELGANDGLRGIPVEKTRENLDLLTGEFVKAGIKVLLAGITLPRNYGPDYIREFDRIFPDLAKKHKVALLPFLLDQVALNPRLMQPDALHPNAEGNRQVARNVFAALRPLLSK